MIIDLNPIPGGEKEWREVIATILTGGAATWAWFKNNYVTAKGKEQKEMLERNKL